MSAPALDKFDRTILALLQRDNLITTEKLGELVGLSSSAVQRRIKRLRDSGVIVRDSAVLDAKSVGRPLTVIVAVAVERETNEVVEAFRRRALAADEVQQCYYVTGEGDFLLVITARSMEEYQDIARRLFLDDPNVRHFSTSVVIEPLKTTLDVPLP
jgi:Lrp/AsnC family transcriptional regulator, leucine-responsive regulatory protein